MFHSHCIIGLKQEHLPWTATRKQPAANIQMGNRNSIQSRRPILYFVRWMCYDRQLSTSFFTNNNKHNKKSQFSLVWWLLMFLALLLHFFFNFFVALGGWFCLSYLASFFCTLSLFYVGLFSPVLRFFLILEAWKQQSSRWNWKYKAHLRRKLYEARIEWRE